MSNIHFSSRSDMWSTPQEFFDKLNDEFAFTTDVCAINENTKCRHFFSPEQDGLKQDWTGTCWMNPPYGREIKNWIKKAYESSKNGTTVVCLIPARTDTTYWHDYIFDKASDIRFIKGRLKFGGHANSAPFPSAVIVYKGRS